MPKADEPRGDFLLFETDEGFILRRAPSAVSAPADELAGVLQHLDLIARTTETNEGSDLEIRFRYRPARLGLLSLYPFVLALALPMIVGWPLAAAIALVIFAGVHVPRDVQSRRRELVAKLSDTLGRHILDDPGAGPYRALAPKS